MRETRHTFCRICESLCGLEVTVDGGEVLEIRPDAEHVATDGFACVKGLKQQQLFSSPDRVRHPLKRVGTHYERVSWQQVYAEIGERVKGLRGEFGPDSIGLYVGTAAGFSLLHPIFAQGFMNGVGSGSIYASATQDCSNKFAVARETYGFPFTQPFPDLDHCGCLIIVGANPVVSKWSFLQVPNSMKRLREIEARGGKVFVVDPRRTETAKAAGRHVFIRPGTDVFFYLAFLNELLARPDGVDRERTSRFMKGFEEVERIAAPWTPERSARVTRIPPETLRELVAAYAEADGAALYSSTGVNMGGNGTLAFWLQEVINAVSGNLDRRGGTLLGKGILDFAKLGRRSGFGLRRDRSRIGDFPTVNDAYPGGVMADEILTPGERQLRALFVTGGNPLITMANSRRLRAAFEELELLVVLDILPTETASLAHYILPTTTPLERPDLPFAFPLFMGMQSHPYLQATRRVVEPRGEQRDEATIYLGLARACAAPLFGSWGTQRALEALLKARSLRLALSPGRPRDEEPALPQEFLMSAILRLTGNGSFKALLKEPHGRRRPDHPVGEYLGRAVATEDGLVDLAPATLVDQVGRLEAVFEKELASQDRFRLITKRHVKTHNSWTHNDPEFVSGSRHTNYLYMHPSDAERVGIAHGEIADVISDAGMVRVPVHYLEDLQPGTVALPHGWGHQHARGLSVAKKTSGVNVNILASDGPEALEPLSGMARLTAIEVQVRPAAGPRNTESWSGLPESEEPSLSHRSSSHRSSLKPSFSLQ
ncbi:MAG: molybdopterin-dependent oxidoreductase [Deltaproteobacteria bacterium]|nr:molybdopterin-dependent oxidoreductase [Deltaproteobacteria bacterium]